VKCAMPITPKDWTMPTCLIDFSVGRHDAEDCYTSRSSLVYSHRCLREWEPGEEAASRVCICSSCANWLGLDTRIGGGCSGLERQLRRSSHRLQGCKNGAISQHSTYRICLSNRKECCSGALLCFDGSLSITTWCKHITTFIKDNSGFVNL